jgi:hypothetical protein
MEVGAYNNFSATGAISDVTSALEYQRVFPKTTTFRFFSSGLPASMPLSYKAAPAAGIRPFYSCKPPQVSTDASNARLARLAGTLPLSTLFTTYHEPENDMDAATFRAHLRNTYQVVKSVNPKVQIGYVAMAYQWMPGKSVKNPEDWYPGEDCCDFLAVDVYVDSWLSTSPKPLRLADHPGFSRWHYWASAKNKPLIVAELGCSHAWEDEVRASWYGESLQWLSDHGYVLTCLWNDGGAPGTYGYWGVSSFGADTGVEHVVRAWAAQNILAPPAPVNPTPWAVPITPDPTGRIKALQDAVGEAQDGLLGEKTLAAIEKVFADRAVLQTKVIEAQKVLNRPI